MPTIHFAKKNRPSISCGSGEVLMKVLLRNQIPVASSCSGDGVCAKCRVKIILGAENLSPADESEKRILSKTFGNDEDRLSCQSRVTGDIAVDTGYW
jgi:2Fe-2S ferredoxin